MTEFRTLDRNNALIKEVYETVEGNIFIRKNQTDNNYCYVYCSSNDLYKKDSESDFVQKIVKGNRFEWMNRSAQNTPTKEIFIRDVWLSWYANGVNQDIDSIEKLIDFIRMESFGIDLVTIRVSSGGFIAAILASECNAVDALILADSLVSKTTLTTQLIMYLLVSFTMAKNKAGGVL